MADNLYQRIKDYILKLPLITCFFLGFLITYLFFFIGPVFFDPSRNMQFIQYIPVLSPIGADFRFIVAASSTWIHSGKLVSINYPAFTLVFFVPFTFLSYGAGYKIMTMIILICFVLITLMLPLWIYKQKNISAVAMLVFITGMISYGLQFELERGQENVIAFMFCLTAIHLYHNYPKSRWLAYLFLSISVQLKLYPAIFVFALIENWSDWKNNIKRFIGLGVLNMAALFIFGLGPMLETFGQFGRAQATQDGRPDNLSIRSFANYILSLNPLPHQGIFLWLEANDWVFQFLLLVFFVICFVIILWQAYKRSSKGFDPYVFMACLVGAMIIPPISFDYKLSILPASIVLFIPAIESFKEGGNRSLIILLAFVFSLAYSSTLYSYRIKPELIRNDLPALLVLLTICTILSCIRSDAMGNAVSGNLRGNSDDH